MRIATWNVNSVRLRLPLLEKFIARMAPDVIVLQETKVVDDSFPRNEISAMGYDHIEIRGMKSYNGVAAISRLPLKRLSDRSFCGREDCRHLGVQVDGIDLHCLYVPAGGDEPDPVKNDKFAHKLAFIDEMEHWSEEIKRQERPTILTGDFNVAPLETDVWSHKQLLKVVSHTPIEVEKLGNVQAAGRWTDAIRHFIPAEEKLYSWWSYRARDWAAADRGRRLDHVWVSPELKGRLSDATILREARGWEKPSDHAPVIVHIE